MKYPVYPEMKDSGVEWLGKIPEHWGTSKLKYLTKSIQTGTTPTTKNQDYFDGEVNWFTPEDIKNSFVLYNSKRKLSQMAISENQAKVFPQKTILLVGIGATIGKVGIINQESSFNQQLTAILTDKSRMLPYFLFYWLYSLTDYIKEYANYTTLPIINNEELKGLICLVPPLNEQKAIANFLDKETDRIDKLIDKKEQLIELLQEKRQALISHAVTKGLDHDVPMKDSGISWLGEIPEHWNTIKISRLFKIIGSGTTPSSQKEEYYNGKIPWVNTAELNDSYICETHKKITEKALKDYSTLTVYPEGTVLIALYGATIGKLGLLNIPATVNQACCALILPQNNVYEKYIFYWLLGNRKHIISLSYGGGQPNISQEIVKSLIVSIPLKEEQQQIVEYLDQETNKIDKLIEKVNKQISNLKEYRKALISNAVTGKIDVREIYKMEVIKPKIY